MEFGEAPLHYMSYLREQILTLTTFFATRHIEKLCGFLKNADEKYLVTMITPKGDDLLAKINRWKLLLCMARFCLDNKVGDTAVAHKSPSTRS